MSANSADYHSYKTVTNPELFQIAWEPFYEMGVRETSEVQSRYRTARDLSYGEATGQKLDLYLPNDVTENTPTLVFLHGGAFREGHQSQYGFLGAPFLERGVAFISASYRLAPVALYPDQAVDVELLASWLVANLRSYGLDSGRVVLSGHSSGALALALAAVRTDWQSRANVPANYLDLVVLSGANYHHLEDSPTNLVRDPARREEATVHCNIRQVPSHAVIVFADDERNTGDGRRFGISGRDLAERFENRGSIVQVFALNTDHQGTCLAIADTEGPVFPAIINLLDFARAN